MIREDAGSTIPPELADWIERFGGESTEDGTTEARIEAAVRALEAALARPGRDREGAFALLAADGLLTSAVDALKDASDPESAFADLLVRVASVSMEPAG